MIIIIKEKYFNMSSAEIFAKTVKRPLGVKVKKKKDDVFISHLTLCFLLWNASFVSVELSFSDKHVFDIVLTVITLSTGIKRHEQTM